jgi:hypothetical protein
VGDAAPPLGEYSLWAPLVWPASMSVCAVVPAAAGTPSSLSFDEWAGLSYKSSGS